ncbi:hypothetical protein V1264_018620 [Littorina saxatilis]|uniref:Reverse transcriptase domain-containing protein n=1 Tax=Littorina saxatilis TaxID=31220 RepID=A0AAN9GCB6_9CAEN
MADEANTPNLRLCKLRRFTGEGDCAETFIQEAKLILQLQTVPALAAAAWILGALDGRARQEVIRRPAAEVNTPAKIYAILEQTWGDQRDSVALAAAFHRRQQGLGESVSEYAIHLRAVWAKTNAAEANTLNDNTLRKTFATGLHPQSLKRDMCRFLREKPAATFDEVTSEAMRWMREDSPAEATAEQVFAAPDPSIARLEARIAALTTETESLKLQLASQPPPAAPTYHHHQQQNHQPQCNWCGRVGHRESDCFQKQRYHNKQRHRPRPQQQQQHQQHEKLLTPAVTKHSAGGRKKKTSLTGQCPTADISINGRPAEAQLDTGSEVTTVTDTWVAQHLAHCDISACHVTLRAVNGAEVPYSGVIVVDISILGHLCNDVPVLVVKEPTEPFMQNRKKRLPVLVGMNVLSTCLPQMSNLPPSLQAAVREVRLDRNSTRGLARTSTPCSIPAYSMATIRVTSNQRYTRQLLASPLSHPLPGGLLTVPTLVAGDPSCRFIRIANLSPEDKTLPARTPIATLHATDTVESQSDVTYSATVNELVISTQRLSSGDTKTPAPAPFHLPDFDGTSSQKQRLEELLSKRADAFQTTPADLGYCDAVHHKLRTTDSKPVAQPYRRIPPNNFKEVQEHLKELLDRNIITESHSPYAAPIVIVRKKDGSIRLCVDYRRLNSKTVGDAYPLPRIQESFDALVGSQYFSTLDLASGYHQIAMDPADQHKTAFVTPMGLYEYTRMPMGLISAPATFQRLMQTTMSEFLFQFLLVYLDDLLVYSKTFDEHLEHLDRLLERLIKTGLKIRPDKCQFLRRQVTYLGHTISAEGISCEAGKVDAVVNWPTPTTTTEVRSFLGFASYYRRFIAKFSKLAGPLHDLVAEAEKGTKKKKKTDLRHLWQDTHQATFDAMKRALTSAPVLAYADFKQPFILETDASHDGLSAILSQEQEGRRRVIAYASRRLRPTEKNQAAYSSMKLEFLAIKWAISEKFRHYLLGATFTVLTDNNPLVHYKTAPLGALEQRWAAQLAQFNFTIKYQPGKTNPADALSRMPPSFPSPTTSTCLPPELAAAQQICCERQAAAIPDVAPAFHHPDTKAEPETIFPRLSSTELQRLQREDSTIGPVLTTWPTKPATGQDRQLRSLVQQHDRLYLRDGVLYRKVTDSIHGPQFQLVLPSTLRPDVLAMLHDNMGHQGYDRTMQLLRSRVYWPAMYSQVKQYLDNCQRCCMGRLPSTTHTTSTPLLASRPLQVLAVDFTKLEIASDNHKNSSSSLMSSASSHRRFPPEIKKLRRWRKFWSTTGSSASGFRSESTVTRAETLNPNS